MSRNFLTNYLSESKIIQRFISTVYYVPETYLEPCYKSMIELFRENSERFLVLSIFAKNCIIDIWHGPNHTAYLCRQKPLNPWNCYQLAFGCSKSTIRENINIYIYKLYSKLTIKTPEHVKTSFWCPLLLTLNILHTLFWYFNR